MFLKKILTIGFVAAVLVACGDNGSSATDSDEDSSSSVCEDCDGSSSSKAKSSLSSSILVEYVDPSTVVKGTMTDERDGQTYKTVKIGTQTWMAENLNYAYLHPTSELDSSSFCYKDSVSYCEKYGRLYLWSAAMDSLGKFSMNGKGCGYGPLCSPTYPVRGVCPKGWHLPDTTEWNALVTAVGGKSAAAKKLKSNSGWKYWLRVFGGNGSDSYSFAALSAGDRFSDRSNFVFEGSQARFWCSDDDFDGEEANIVLLDYNIDYAVQGLEFKYYEHSVRCVKDE